MAALEKFVHVASTTVSSGGTTAPAAGTTETWTVASSSSFPTAATNVIKFKVADPAANSEIILVTNVSGTTWTVTRGADGTTPVAHAAGFTVKNVVTATSLNSAMADTVATFNVLDYGAKGDDSNADHVGIQAALDAAYANGGGRVYIPKGKYRIMQVPIKIRENIQVSADNSAVIKRYNNGSSMIWNGDSNQVRAGYTGHGNILVEGGIWDMRSTVIGQTMIGDPFTRADSTTSPGSDPNGGAWAETAGGFGIISNQAYAPVAGTNIATQNAFDDGTVMVTYAAGATSTNQAGLVFRLSDASNYWYYRRFSTGNAQLAKVVAGVETVITPSLSQAVANGDRLKVVFFQNTIQAYVNDVLTHTTTDTFNQTATRVGMIATDITSRLDNFSFTVPKIVAWDDFNRANTTAPHELGTSPYSNVWITEGTANAVPWLGGTGIVSNTVFGVTNGGANMSTVFGFSDGTVSLQIPTTTGGFVGLVFRVSDSQNFWYWRRHSSGTVILAKTVNGVETQVTTSNPQTMVDGDTMSVVLAGPDIKVFVNSNLAHSLTDYTHMDERKVGVQVVTTTARVDNFQQTASIWADTFNRADSATGLGTTSSNQAWTAQAGTLGISSNRAYAPSAGDNVSTVPVTSETNVEVRMPVAGNAGVVFRYKDQNNYWYYRRHTDGTARMGKWVDGVETVMTADAVTTINAGDTLKVETLGWEIRGYVNNISTHLDDDASLYQERLAGIQILDTTARLDDFDSWAASATQEAGACFNIGHADGITLRDMIIRDCSLNSHAVEIAGCRNVLFDNMSMLGAALVPGRESSEALQLDITARASVFGSYGPHDHTPCRDVTVRNCTFMPSYSAGTQAWGRGVGSHSATIGRWHENIVVTGNYFEVVQRAVAGYNWRNSVVSSNNCATGMGIELTTVSETDTLDTLNLTGAQTSASQPVVNLVVADNTILHDYLDSSTDYAIRIRGYATGHVQGATITGNVVRSSLSGGIRVEYTERAILANNQINLTNWHGITFDTVDDSLMIGNTLTEIGRNGIYIQGGNRNRVFQNYIRGANRTGLTTTPSACIRLDTSANEVTLGGNTTRKWGSGNEPDHGLYQSTGTNTMQLDNDFVGGGSISDVNVLASAEIGRSIYREATTTTALGTTVTAIAGLTMTLPVGRWRFTGWIPIVNVGGPTNTTVTVSPTGAPTATNIVYTIEMIGTLSDADYGTEVKTAFNSVTTSTLLSNVVLIRIEGTCTVTTAGTLSVSATRVGGTSQTVQIGAYIQADRK